MSNASETKLSYVEETTYGTTPATPAFQEQRFTGEGLNANRETTTSNEIRADRNVTDVIQTGQNAGGNVDIELSYGSFDDWLESLMFNTWASNVLKNGTAQKSFTIEKLFEAGATDQYHRFTGAVANSLSLSIQAGQLVTGSFDFLAKGAATGQTAIAGSTYTAANTNDVINAAVDFAGLAVTGAATPQITALNLNITNNLRQQREVGSIDSAGLGTGRFEVTGDFNAYFKNQELYDMFLAGTATDLTFTLGGASSKKYQFEMDKIKFESGEIIAGGNDQDVLQNFTFRALFEGTDNTLKITRTP